MDHLLLARARPFLVAVSLLVALLAAPATAAPKEKRPQVSVPELLLPAGRSLVWESSLTSDRELRKKPRFWTRVLDLVAGEPEAHFLVRPYGVAVDSHGRVIVSDPGAQGIHIFDVEKQKYKFIERRDARKDPLRAPQCITVDSQDQIYVTDSESGKIFVFEPGGKFKRTLGSLRGGEGFFKRPTGIAVDSSAQRIYVSDTLRDKVFVLDMDGNVVTTLGDSGRNDVHFKDPTELLLHGGTLAVVDAMNFRVQVFDGGGALQYSVGTLGQEPGQLFRPKGIGFDSENHLYVVDALSGMIQVFNREGQLLYQFGERGTGVWQFQLPSGLFIDRKDRIYVVDSFNRRIQIFQYHAVSGAAGDAK
jgi:DNA-binding beta-propeller fold protein YncE